MPAPTALDLEDLRRELPALAAQLGFNAIGVSGIDLAADEARLLEWLAAGRHGRMHYMERHGTLRSRPAELLPGTLRVISARMDYWPGDAADAETTLHSPSLGYVSRYALGRDYHKVLRGALQTLAGQIAERYEKALLIRFTTALEIVIMSVAAVGFIYGIPWLLMFCLFMTGVQSTLFGPVKYAILPQHLKSEELVGGNALIEAGTFVAILLISGFAALLGIRKVAKLEPAVVFRG